ncbi:bifunctional transcriptional activator/DNA repair enzyme AdaA [Paenibacillus lignilyticus]|nr:Ada metal-binding domain-containing protein [Paenibacillus lignilyticus]
MPMMTSEMWLAIASCDASYDGRFYYGVSSTGIFCRPSCKSRTPNPKHVHIFLNAQAALASEYRPCKRCKPEGRRLPEEEWVESIAAMMNERYEEPLTLAALAELAHVSPYHIQRTFKRIKGKSPAAYLQQVRVEAAKELLLSATELTISEIGVRVGYPNAAHFATVYQKETGSSPSAYRMAAANPCKKMDLGEDGER